jgi:hypothetical protein
MMRLGVRVGQGVRVYQIRRSADSTVVEEFQGETIWQADVEIFEIRGHPKTTQLRFGYTTNEQGG